MSLKWFFEYLDYKKFAARNNFKPRSYRDFVYASERFAKQQCN